MSHTGFRSLSTCITKPSDRSEQTVHTKIKQLLRNSLVKIEWLPFRHNILDTPPKSEILKLTKTVRNWGVG